MIDWLLGLPGAFFEGCVSFADAFLTWGLGFFGSPDGGGMAAFFSGSGSGLLSDVLGLANLCVDMQVVGTAMGAAMLVLGTAIALRFLLWVYHQMWGAN